MCIRDSHKQLSIINNNINDNSNDNNDNSVCYANNISNINNIDNNNYSSKNNKNSNINENSNINKFCENDNKLINNRKEKNFSNEKSKEKIENFEHTCVNLNLRGGEKVQLVQPKKKRELPPALKKNIWKPGQSGNPAGRPKKEGCVKELLEMEGKKNVTTKDGRTLTKFQALIERVWIQAINGDASARDFILNRTEGKVPDNINLQAKAKVIPVIDLTKRKEIEEHITEAEVVENTPLNEDDTTK